LPKLLCIYIIITILCEYEYAAKDRELKSLLTGAGIMSADNKFVQAAKELGKGRLTDGFNNGQAMTAPAREMQQRNTHQLVSGGNNASMMQTSSARNEDRKSEEKKRERDKQYRLWLMEAVQRAKSALDDLALLNDMRLAQAITDLDEKNLKLAEVNETIAAMNEAIENIDKGEQLTLDDDGKLTNKRLEAVIEKWEEENGRKADRTDMAFVRALFKDYGLPKSAEEKERLEKWIQLHKEQIDFYTRMDGRISEQQKKGEDIEHKSPEEQQEWLNENDDITNDYNAREAGLKAQENQLSKPDDQTNKVNEPSVTPQVNNAPVPSL
jgi:hypothetical protein